MIPLVVQLAAWAVFVLPGAVGLSSGTLPVTALRWSLSVMFAFTAVSHFVPRTRADLVRMVPPALRAPTLLVTLTGVLELAGAAGLLVPVFARASALALAALLLALLPANIHADRAGLPIGGRRATPLRWRIPVQLFWVGCLLWVAADSARHA